MQNRRLGRRPASCSAHRSSQVRVGLLAATIAATFGAAVSALPTQAGTPDPVGTSAAPTSSTGAPTVTTSGQTRTAAMSYSAPGGFTAAGGAVASVLSPGPWLAAQANETQIRAAAQDSTGRPVALAVEYQPLHATSPVTHTFCGFSPWLSITPRSQVRSEVLAGTCPDGQVSAPTTGTLAVTFFHPLPPRHLVAPPSMRWAVIIGISHYASPTEPTYGGDGDATAVRRSLLQAGWLPSHIRDLRDGRASAHAIIAAERWLVAHSSAGTFTLFHYSGHVCIASRGPCASGHTFLWGSDNGFISEDSFASVLRGLRGYSWIDIAGCESGAFDVGLHSSTRLFTASSQPGRTSYEEPKWHESVWTGLTWDHAYLQGDATRGHPFAATIGQMVGYGVRNTPALTQGQSAGTQHPYRAGGNTRWRLSAPPG